MSARCIGTIKCLSCANEIPVKQNEQGTINLSCAYCDISSYAKRGTLAERFALGKIKRLPGHESMEPEKVATPAKVVAEDVKGVAAPVIEKKSELPWANK